MKDYIVIRLRFTSDSEIHSVEYFPDEHSAWKRYSNIWAADINNNDVVWNGVFMLNSNGLNNFTRYEINDLREDKKIFLILFRFYEEKGTMTHSIQYYYPTNENYSTEYMKALARWFNIIAADLMNANITANGSMLFDSFAAIKEQRAFRRELKPEPEPEPEVPEEQEEPEESGEEPIEENENGDEE